MACGHDQGLAEARVVSPAVLWRTNHADLLVETIKCHAPGLDLCVSRVQEGIAHQDGRPGSRGEVEAPKTPFLLKLQALLAWCVNRLGSASCQCSALSQGTLLPIAIPRLCIAMCRDMRQSSHSLLLTLWENIALISASGQAFVPLIFLPGVL